MYLFRVTETIRGGLHPDYEQVINILAQNQLVALEILKDKREGKLPNTFTIKKEDILCQSYTNS